MDSSSEPVTLALLLLRGVPIPRDRRIIVALQIPVRRIVEDFRGPAVFVDLQVSAYSV